MLSDNTGGGRNARRSYGDIGMLTNKVPSRKHQRPRLRVVVSNARYRRKEGGGGRALVSVVVIGQALLQDIG